MQRILTDGGVFIAGDPSTNTKGSIVTAAWLNAIQEELAAILELAGETLDSGDNNQIGALLQGRASPIPVGVVMPFIGGYFTSGANGGFTDVLGNTPAAVNATVNANGFYVCDGAALDHPMSPIYNGAGRYLPNLTDDRFLMGDTAAGVVGGDNDMVHTHTIAHTHTITHTHTFAHTHYIDHTHATGDAIAGASTAAYGITGDGDTRHHTHDTGGSTVPTSGGASVSTTSGASNGNSGSASVSTSGAASITENRPKFLSCLYIIKVIQ
jgi:hypothetical protein